MDSWTIFILCCVGLWIPGWPLWAIRRNQIFRRLNPEGQWPFILTIIPNWTDFTRSGILSFVILKWYTSYTVANPEDAKTALGALLGCMVLSTLIQCLFIKHRRLLVVPGFYILGMLLFLAGWEIGLLATLGAFGISYGLRSPTAILPVFGVLLVAGGYVIKAPIMQLAVGGIVAFLPLVVCLFSNRTGVLPAHIPLGRAEVSRSEAGASDLELSAHT